MTRRKTPKNKTIVKEALKRNADYGVDNPACIETGRIFYYNVQENDLFIFPDDLDRIQPDQINGNLTIKFPD